MQTIHLTEYHLGGAPQGGAASEGTTPAPQLPDAGKPYVDSLSYDKDAKKVRLRAQNARAGEVKTPLGEEQTFDIPAEPAKPAAGFKGYFYRFLVDDEARSGDSISGTVETDLGQVRSKHGETKAIETKKYPLTSGTTNAYKLQIDCLPDYTYRILPEDTFSVEDGYLCITQKIKFVDAYGTGPASEAWANNNYPVV